jgi:SAM-dependent methyltransferase
LITLKNDAVRNAVSKTYGEIAIVGKGCGCKCCGESTAENVSQAIGYSRGDISSVPQGANMGLGCGNPQAIANLKKGETVLDLGSGGGFDCFLAARQVGDSGYVIGVDMTPEMITRAKANAEETGSSNQFFHQRPCLRLYLRR